jgi:hypothetical protein
MFVKESSTQGHFWIDDIHSAHTSVTAEQLQSACPTVSFSFLQIGHKGSEIMPFLYRFAFVGRISAHALQRKFLTTPVPGSAHIFFHF